jgi:hypothetical protein
METSGKRIVDRYPHLREGAERQQMLVRNAIGSARVEGIRPDESRLRRAVTSATKAPGAARGR